MTDIQGVTVEFDELNQCWHITTSGVGVLGTWFSIFFDEYQIHDEGEISLIAKGDVIGFINGLHPKNTLLLEIEFERVRK